MLNFAESQGEDTKELVQNLGLEGIGDREEHMRVPLVCYDQLWATLVEKTGNPLLSLKFAQGFSGQGQNHVFYLMILKCCNGLQILEKLCRYHDVMSNHLHLSIKEEGERVLLVLKSQGTSLTQRLSVEAFSAVILGLLSHVSKNHILPQRIGFQHQAAGAVADYKKAYGLSPDFSAKENHLVFNRSVILEPLHPSDPKLLLAIESYVQNLLENITGNIGLAGRVKEILVDSLGGRLPTLQEVAKKMALSPRGLQQKLALEGSSFRKLVNEVRREMAVYWLREGTMSMGEITFMLGFAEQSAFVRAFHRYEGVAPVKFREEVKPKKL